MLKFALINDKVEENVSIGSKDTMRESKQSKAKQTLEGLTVPGS